MKKFVSLVVTVALICSSTSLALSANAASVDSIAPSHELSDYITEDTLPEGVLLDGDYQYKELDNGTVQIYRYIGKNEKAVIPSQIKGKNVTSIGSMSFSMTSIVSGVSVTEVEIPNTVKRIEELAFFMGGLTKMNIPANVEYIGMGAFSASGTFDKFSVDSKNPYFSENDGIIYNKNQTELVCCPPGKTGEIEIPDGVKTIDEAAFYYCTQITDVFLPEPMDSIGMGAFAGCTGLVGIMIPEGVTKIEDYTFQGCESLKQLYLPKSLKEFGEEIFKDADNVVMYCYKDTPSMQYAIDNEIAYMTMLDEDLDYIAGDLDNDTSVTSSDALVVLRASIGMINLVDNQTIIADVNKDGEITSSDALDILRYSAGFTNNEYIGSVVDIQ